MSSLSTLNFFQYEREESPRPTKRRNSGPTMEQTPRPLPLSFEPALPKRARLLPKTPLAPRPAVLKPISLFDEPKPEVFVPSTDMLDQDFMAPPMPLAARLKPRAMLIPKLTHRKVSSEPTNTLAEIANAKPLQRSKAVPAPNRSSLKQSRSCHALCA